MGAGGQFLLGINRRYLADLTGALDPRLGKHPIESHII
jgi:hypothetical protein